MMIENLGTNKGRAKALNNLVFIANRAKHSPDIRVRADGLYAEHARRLLLARKISPQLAAAVAHNIAWSWGRTRKPKHFDARAYMKRSDREPRALLVLLTTNLLISTSEALTFSQACVRHGVNRTTAWLARVFDVELDRGLAWAFTVLRSIVDPVAEAALARVEAARKGEVRS